MTQYQKDLAERVASAYLFTFLGLVIAGWGDVKGVKNLSIVGSAALAAIPAALSVAKGGIAKLFGNPDTASLTV